jgi:hypothetical protein
MKKLSVLILFAFNVHAESIKICEGEYALCAASPATLTGKSIRVKGKEYREAVAVCPILSGKAFANLSLMNNSCDAPKGFVWSLFGVPPQTSYPQAPDWSVKTAVFNYWTIGKTPTTGMSNMWSMLCNRQAQPINSVYLASCYGPVMESPFTNNRVKPGEIGFSQAPAGSTYSVGGNIKADHD